MDRASAHYKTSYARYRFIIGNTMICYFPSENNWMQSATDALIEHCALICLFYNSKYGFEVQNNLSIISSDLF